MKRKVWIALAVGVLILAQLACGINWGNTPTQPPAAPTATEVPATATTVPSPTPKPTDVPTAVPGPTEDPCTGLQSMIYFAKASDLTKQFLVVLDDTPKYIPTDPKQPIVTDKVQFERDTAAEILAEQKALPVPPIYVEFQDHRVKAMEAFVTGLDNAINGDRVIMAVYFQIMIQEEDLAEIAAKAIDTKCGFGTPSTTG